MMPTAIMEKSGLAMNSGRAWQERRYEFPPERVESGVNGPRATGRDHPCASGPEAIDREPVFGRTIDHTPATTYAALR
jgi:hypothetical protein